MGRFPRLRFSMKTLGTIDAIYISHAHCDHLDPYTLVRIWKEMEQPPVLWLPISLSFLLPLFNQYLDDPDIRILPPLEPVVFRGIELFGFYNVDSDPSNEDDVMILVATNGSERVLVEADARLALDLINFRTFISSLLCDSAIKSAVYLTTENELNGTIESRLCETAAEREELQEMAFNDLVEAVNFLYVPIEHQMDEDPTDLWHGNHVLRLIHGQGLSAPHELDSQWHSILFPIRLNDRVQIEQQIAAHNGYCHSIEGLTVGSTHLIEQGEIIEITPMEGLELLGHETERDFEPYSPFFPTLLHAPLRGDKRNTIEQRLRLTNLLNQVFLPYLHGNRHPPFLHILAEHQGTYSIRIYYGNAQSFQMFDYIVGYEHHSFVEHTVSNDIAPESQEAYWANDIEDLLDGRCDEFSVFCRRQFPVPYMRLWSCLATPLLNSEYVKNRVRIHFERATQGLTPGSWVLNLYKTDSRESTIPKSI